MNPIYEILGGLLINSNFDHRIVILQEFSISFSTPKSKKALALAEVMTDSPTGSTDPSLNDALPDEHLFLFSSNDPWYGDSLVYLRT